MTLGIALLGTGTIAQHALIPAVHAVDGAHLVAVLSRDKARGTTFAQQYGIPEVYDDLTALLRSPQVEAVIVATPDAMHEPQVIAAAQAGLRLSRPLTRRAGGVGRLSGRESPGTLWRQRCHHWGRALWLASDRHLHV